MIFVTVGDNLPFDRLVKAVDHWAQLGGRDDVFAQIGDSDFRPNRIAYCRFIASEDFNRHIREARVVISHAGMGSILSALLADKPILVMPRLFSLREIRNDHQLATARKLREIDMVNVAFNEDELQKILEHLDLLKSKRRIEEFAGESLLSHLRAFIAQV